MKWRRLCPPPLPQVVPAEYAFVAHTADPLTGEAGVTVGEVVVGMGEALVGNMPGRALSFTTAGSNGAGAALPPPPPPPPPAAAAAVVLSASV